MYNRKESEAFMEKEFKVRMNVATIIFLCAYALYTIYVAVTKDMNTFITIAIFGVLCCIFFLGFRPYKYIIGKKSLSIHYRLWRKRQVDLMECETICDPVSRWADIATRPHAIEIYTNTKKRYCCFPKQRVEFVAAVMKENKRIHCTVKAYTDVHRQLEKQQRKEKEKQKKSC